MKYPYYFWPESSISWSTRTGMNAKRTLIMASAAEIAGNLPFLKKILRAIDLDFDQDIHFIPVADDLEMPLMSDPQITNYESIVLFGIRPTLLGIKSEKTSACQVFYFEKCVCIAAPSLPEIETKAEQKKQLWSVLKLVFQQADE